MVLIIIAGIYIFGAVITAAIAGHFPFREGLDYGDRVMFVGACVVLWPLAMLTAVLIFVLFGVGRLILGGDE